MDEFWGFFPQADKAWEAESAPHPERGGALHHTYGDIWVLSTVSTPPTTITKSLIY